MNRNDDMPHQKVLDLFSLAADLPAKATSDTRQQAATRVGYGEEEFANAPEDALLGIGCGNPVALASLEAGQVVLDLGSGGGFDAFLASKAVGSEGRVIGVDFNPKMLARARQLAKDNGYGNVEFREGAIEDLPPPAYFYQTVAEMDPRPNRRKDHENPRTDSPGDHADGVHGLRGRGPGPGRG